MPSPARHLRSATDVTTRGSETRIGAVIEGWDIDNKGAQMRGIRHFLRNFTASAVREHLRSEIEATGGLPELTKNEIELVRFIRAESFDWDGFLARLAGPSLGGDA
jgi:hypothetical protein